MTLGEAKTLAEDWYERSGKYPKWQDGLWRWILPEVGKEDAASELPAPVFNRLRSMQKHPWLFQSRTEAEIMAKIAAQRAILNGEKLDGR